MRHELEIQKLEKPTPEIESALDAGFEEFSKQTIGDSRKPFSFCSYDSQKLIGACKGYSYTDDLYVSQLWIHPQFRKAGLGRRIMEACEILARDRGCIRIWVDTLSYQAPDFYVRCGFQEQGRIAGYRGSYDRIFFAKGFAKNPVERPA